MLNSVSDFFINRKESVEKHNEKNIKKLRWNHPDVLYSFKGVYALGVFIYYPERFKRNPKNDIIINNASANRQLLYSNKYLSVNYESFTDVNELKEIQLFLKHYYNIGNVIPTWPGANVNRGQSHCYDIPNVYFKSYEQFTKFLCNEVYKNSHMNFLLDDSKYDTVEKLLKMNKDEYKEFLRYIINIIEDRNKKIERSLHNE